MKWISEILEHFPDKDAAASALASLSKFDDPLGRLFGDPQSARQAASRFSQALPLSVLPVGENRDGLIVLDLCAAGLERGVLPVLHLQWNNLFFESIAPSMEVWINGPAVLANSISDHPTSFAVYAEHVLSEPGESYGLAARWAQVFERPLYTARSFEQIRIAQSHVLTCGETIGIDPLALRLARCGLDSEQWRIVGAERAVANRVRCALRALEGALFLGAPRTAIAKVVERMARAAGWTVAVRLLRWHQGG